MQHGMKGVLAALLGIITLASGMDTAPAGSRDFLFTNAGIVRNGKLILDRNTPANKDALARVFRGYRIKVDEYWGEGERYFRYIVVDRKGRKVFVVEPDGQAVSEVRAFTRRARDAWGIRPGDTFRKLRASGRISCSLSAEDGVFWLCSRPETADNLQYVFRRSDDMGRANVAMPKPRQRIRQLRLFCLSC